MLYTKPHSACLLQILLSEHTEISGKNIKIIHTVYYKPSKYVKI